MEGNESSITDSEIKSKLVKSPNVGIHTWSNAEILAEEVIDTIVTDGGFELFHKYLIRKSVPRSADVLTDALVEEMKMCFIPPEQLSTASNWEEEPTPKPNVSDSWVRLQMPGCTNRDILKRKPVKLVRNSDTERRGASSNLIKTKKNGLAAEINQKSYLELGKAIPNTELENRKHKLQWNVLIDEEEEKYRLLKAADEKRKRDLALQIATETAQKEQREKKLISRKEELDRKPHTFDSDGKVLWVNPPNLTKVPKVTEELPYQCRDTGKPEKVQEKKDDNDKDEIKSKKKAKGKGRPKKVVEERKEQEFTDTFTKLTSQQPPIINIIKCTGGVHLGLNGRSKKGPEVTDPVHQMSRAKYDSLALSMDDDLPSSATNEESQQAEMPNREDPVPILENFGRSTEDLPPVKVNAADLPKGEGTIHEFNAAIQQDSEWGLNIESNNKRVEVGAPSTTKNWMMKRNAVGNLGRLPRFHTARLGTGFGGLARCLPQPILGATMGHGLHGGASQQSMSQDNFFFPPSQGLPKREMPRSQKTKQGAITRSSSDFRELGAKLLSLNHKAGMENGRIVTEGRGRLLTGCME